MNLGDAWGAEVPTYVLARKLVEAAGCHCILSIYNENIQRARRRIISYPIIVSILISHIL